jgi:hypothetical protein
MVKAVGDCGGQVGAWRELLQWHVGAGRGSKHRAFKIVYKCGECHRIGHTTRSCPDLGNECQSMVRRYRNLQKYK